MQDPRYDFPPPGADPSWNPNGPDGQLMDVGASATIGELVRVGLVPPYGWVRGEYNTAIPMYNIPGQPTQAEIMTIMNSQYYASTSQTELSRAFLAALLITLFD